MTNRNSFHSRTFFLVCLAFISFLNLIAQTQPNGTVTDNSSGSPVNSDLNLDLRLWLDTNDKTTLYRTSTVIAGESIAELESANTGTDYTGTEIQLWLDKSNFNSHVSNTDLTKFPTYVADGGTVNNNLPTLEFLRSQQDHLRIALPETNAGNGERWEGEYTVFIVFEQLTDGGIDHSFFSNGDTFADDNHFQISVSAATGDDFVFKSNNAANVKFLDFEPEKQNELKLYSLRSDANGTEALVDGTRSDFDATLTNNGNKFWAYNINRNRNNNSFNDSRISEVIIYDRILTDCELSEVNKYLGNKYGKDFSSSFGALYNDNLNPAYDNVTAGIGLNEALCGGVTDKQNTATSNGFTLSVDDADNTINRNYIAFSDNGGTETRNDDVPTGTPFQRMDKSWLLQEYGNNVLGDQALDFEFDVPAIWNGLSASSFIVLIDDDGDFSDAELIADGVLSSNKILFENVVLGTDTTLDLQTDTPIYLALAIYPSPGGIATGLEFWIKADAGIYEDANTSGDSSDTAEDNDVVQAWHDNSGFDNHLDDVVVGTPTLRMNSLNYNPSVEFDGDNDRIDWDDGNIPWFEGDQQLTIYSVVKADALGYRGWIDTETADDSSEQVFISQTTTNNGTFTLGANGDSPANYLVTSQDIRTTDPMIFGFDYDGNASTINTLYNAYIDGREYEIAGGNSTNGPIPIGVDKFSLGDGDSGAGSNNEWDGQIAEVMTYEKVLTSNEKQRVESYLALKYGITLNQSLADGAGIGDYLSSDGTVVFDAPAEAADAFNHGITGIGRDDASGLNQKQSKSINDGGIVAMGLTTIEVTNAANTATFANDRSFMVWANNDGAATWSATGAPANYQLLEKTWQLQETGAVGAVTLQFDVADTDFDVPDLLAGTEYYLVYDSDDDDDLGDETPVALNNVSGSLWATTSAIDFSDGTEFTLATEGTYDISGIVYYDEDGEGDLDASETTRLQDVTVSLYDDDTGTSGNGVYDGDEDLVGAAQVSAATTGAYTFTDVPNGEYIIVVDATDTALNNDANNGSRTYGATTAKQIAVSISGSNVIDQNFGFDEALVSLSIDETTLNEDGTIPNIADVTATIVPTTEFATTVALSFSGAATDGGADYTASATSIPIPANTAMEKITITAAQDTEVEGDETVVIDIDSVTNGTEDGTQQVTTTIVDDEISVGASGTEISATDGAATANGSDTETITLQLKDDSGNILEQSGVDITFASDSGTALLSSTTATTDAMGTATITLTNTVAETVNITATVDADNDGGATPEIAVTNGSPAQVIFTTSGIINGGASGTLISAADGTATSNGTDTETISIQLKDEFGNNIETAGIDVTFATTGSAVLSSTTATTNTSGIASITLTNMVEETVSVTATGDLDDNGGTAQTAISNGNPTLVVFSTSGTQKFLLDAIADTNVNENTAYTGPTPNAVGNPVGDITYTLGGTDAADFTIDGSTGVVSMVARNFENPQDDDTDNIYELSITATDDDGNSDSEAWTVTVDDVTETVSFTIDAIADANVDENSAYTGVTPNLSGDAPIGDIIYTLGGTDAADFTIDASTGVVSMVARDFEAPADNDTDNVYEVSITATDDDGNSDSEAWTVTVDDVTETVSFTIDAIADANVNENSAYTGVTPNLSGDAPIGDIIYTLGGTDAADFTIDASTGVVSMVARDFEAPADNDTDNVYEVSITATDDDGNSDSEAWTVTVDDVTETVSFTIDAIADANVNENSAYTGVTPNLSGDAPIGDITYTLGGTDATDFTIDASTGVVSMVARDFEAPADNDTDNVYEVSITATDDDGNSDSEAWTVTVDDVTETVSFTIDAIADANVNENSAYTGVTPNLSGDAPIGDITYTLGGTDATDFTIDASTGVVSMVARDFEAPADNDTDNVYEVSITATDDDGNSDSEAWTVTVDDVTETVSFTIDAIADANVNENSAYTGVTPNLSGDAPIGDITYTLGGTDATDFTIDASTGVVSMVARDFEAPADNDTDNVYELNITATDDDGNSDSEAWTVTVDNVNETVSFSIDTISDETIDEETPYTGPIPSITGTPIGNVSYTLGGADAAIFSIDSATGQVFMPLRSFENPDDVNNDNTYEVSITASDEDGNEDTEDWTVTLLDVLEPANFTISVITDASVEENVSYTGPIPILMGDDPIGTVTYTMDGADRDNFTINASTGVVSMMPRDFEIPVDTNTDNVYEVTITATDDDGNSDSESWTVVVINVVEDTLDSDGDGLPDEIDPDDNNPDTDGDGIPDGADADVDGDGTVDNGTDTDGDGINDANDVDVDGDGTPDNGMDSDGDGISDENDTVDDTLDSDGDGLPDALDPSPNNPDMDGDGIPDGADADVDGDGTVDNGTDTDGDGINDANDVDVDGDGTPDNGTDSDGDGINDENDTIDDNPDSDGDGVPDSEDAFPNDPNESVDEDGDGVGANTDLDDNDVNVGGEQSITSAEAFTPNGDGINDFWVIQGIENHPNAIVTVYNRYGHEVFKAIGYQNNWTGRNGSGSGTLPAGSYYYIIELRNGSAPVNGWIFINY